MRLEGIHTAIITPFDDADTIDTKALRSLTRRQLQGGVDGVVVLGTTGEASTLEERERDVVISTVVETVKGELPVMVGCGSPSTKQVIKFAKRAQELGADCLQVVTPYYNRPTQEGIYLHFKAISEVTDLPLCIYNIPSRAGQNIETATLERIAHLPNVISVKEASGNILQMGDVIEKIVHKRQNFTIISGDDALFLPLMAIGGHGVMSVISNLLPRTVKKLYQAIVSGDMALARALHYALKPLCAAAFIETNPIPIKFMLAQQGLCSSSCRLPLCPLMKSSIEKISHTLTAAKQLLDDET